MKLKHDTKDGPDYTLRVYGEVVVGVTQRFIDGLPPDPAWQLMVLETAGGLVELLDVDRARRTVRVRRYDEAVYSAG